MFRTKILEGRLEEKSRRYFGRHPVEAFLCMFVMLPVGMLLAVSGFTVFFALPIGLLCGWL